MSIKTDEYSIKLRAKAINVSEQKLLISKLLGSDQEKDISAGVNCAGYGRLRHFRKATSEGWPQNPLPIEPACAKLGLPSVNILLAQVFQNAACNWRCWYCYVPFDLLAANENKSSWLTAKQLLDYFLAEENRAPMIDLSGGQPDLTPEWIPWMMDEITSRGLQNKCYLWSDDNLSNDYFWRYLSLEQIATIRSYKNYGKVCCFKGFDSESFAFNTSAEPDLFDRQFELFKRYLDIGLDVYAYTTFTTPNGADIQEKMNRFVDRLQALHHNLPLRTVPLEIKNFGPMQQRTHTHHEIAIRNQQEAIRCWNNEIQKRFSEKERGLKIYDVPIR